LPSVTCPGRFTLAILCLCAAPVALPARARADEPAPLVAHAAAGASFGLAIGLGAGYLVARREGWEGGADWRTVGYGAGAGALGGALLGLGVGGIERARRDGRRWPVLAGAAGLAFDGAVLGAVCGSAAALAMHDKEQILHGASIGVLTGGAVGLGAALWAAFHADGPIASAGASVALTPLVSTGVRGNDLVWLPSLMARY
jgi:hypothetical protein